MAVPLAADADVAPAVAVVGTIVNVCRHDKALKYAASIFRSSPVVSDTHGGHLKMQRLMAQGSWSLVYRVMEMVEREKFALKVVPQQGSHITSYYEDVRKLNAMKHPHIVEMHNHFVFQEEDSPCPLLCIRLELCRFSLEEYIQSRDEKQRPILAVDVCLYTTQLASALAYIHRQGTLHGDVCSANVLLAEGPRDSLAVRLTNFGSSQRVVRPGAAPLTITGGSRAYAPPEWVNSTTPCRPFTPFEAPLPSYDLWGLGCVLSEMATMKLISGERMPHEDSLAKDLCCLAALKEEMASTHDGTFAELCCGLLEVDPDERPTAEAVPSHLPAAPHLQSKPSIFNLRHPSHISDLFFRPFGVRGRP